MKLTFLATVRVVMRARVLAAVKEYVVAAAAAAAVVLVLFVLFAVVVFLLSVSMFLAGVSVSFARHSENVLFGELSICDVVISVDNEEVAV